MAEAETGPAGLGGRSHPGFLNVLARAEPEGLKRHKRCLRVGPGWRYCAMRDSARCAAFHLGEVLVAEAHPRGGRQVGYRMRRGRDLDAAMAMALIGPAVVQGVGHREIGAYIAAEAGRQAAGDDTRLRAAEAARVDMETFWCWARRPRPNRRPAPMPLSRP